LPQKIENISQTTLVVNNALLSCSIATSCGRRVVETAHAEMMEEYVRQNFKPDALVEAQRIGNGIRMRATQVGTALK
jgi:aminopeptidase N